MLRSAAVVCFLLLASCTKSSIGSDSVVYSVNEHQLTSKQFADLLAQRLRPLDALSAKDPNVLKQAKEEVLKSFLMRSLVSDYAKTEGLKVDDPSLEKEINAIRAGYPDDISFRRMLAEQSISLSEWKELVRQSLLDTLVFKKMREKIPAPTENEIAQYYNQNKDSFRKKERVFLRQIVVDQLAKADAVKEELKRRDFADVAKKYSVSPEGKRGGAVGWVERGSVDIFDKAFGLAVGSTSQILESPYGFHIFKVDRKTAAGIVSKEEVREQIISSLKARREQAEFMGWLDKQLRTGRVLKNTAVIDAMFVETKGTK